MCVLLVAAEGEVAPRDVLEHVRRGSSRPPYPAVPGPSGRSRLDTSRRAKLRNRASTRPPLEVRSKPLPLATARPPCHRTNATRRWPRACPRGTGRGRPSPSRPDLDDSRRLFFVCLVFAWFSKRSLYIFFMHSYTAQRGRRRVTRPEKPRPTKVAAETSPGLAGPREAWRAFPPHHLTSPPESQTNSPPVRCTFVKRARGGGGAI